MWNVGSHRIRLWIFLAEYFHFFSTCIHMLFLPCGNNVQICVFHVEYSATRDLTVDFLLFMFNVFHMNSELIDLFNIKHRD